MAVKGSDTIYDFCCNVCEEDNVNKEAVFYCQKCSKGYCDECIDAHKQLFRKHEPIGRDELDKWPTARKILDALQCCQQHTGQSIELFCEDHSTLCCHLCHFHEHRQCTKLVLIAEKAKDVHQAGDFQQLAAIIDSEQQKLDHEIGLAKEWLKILQNSYDKASKEIKLLRNKINDILDRLENNTVQSLDTLLDTLKKALQSDIDKCSKLKEDFKNIKEAIKEVENQQNDQTFIAYTKSMEMVSNTQTLLKETSANRNVTITFQANHDIEQCLSGLSNLANVVHSSSGSETNVSGEIIKCNWKRLYNVKCASDKTTCFVQGICELSSSDLLIVDRTNERVKLLDKQYNVVAHTELSATPWDMCNISPTEVAVAIDNGKTHAVQFLSVNNRQIVKGRILNFELKCKGIAHFKGSLYIASVNALYQYTLGGQLVKKIYENRGHNTVYKCAVSPDGTRLYITNYSKNKLLTLSMDGTLLSSVEDPALRIPTCVHVSETGQLLVGGWESHNVVQVDSEGGVVTLASKDDGLNYPESVYYSAQTARVIVGQHSDSILVINSG